MRLLSRTSKSYMLLSAQTVTREQVDAWMTELSNWGRCGKEARPIHQLAIVALGLPLIDGMDLEAIARPRIAAT